jgi:hypothetical protein
MDKHNLRKNIDKIIFEVEEDMDAPHPSRDYSRALALVRTKLQEAKMWTGKLLEAQGKELPSKFRDHCEERTTHDTELTEVKR